MKKYYLSDYVGVALVFLALFWGASKVIEVGVMTVKAGLNATPDQELVHLEDLYLDWEPPSDRPILCWSWGWPIGGHGYHCPEDKRFAVVKPYRHLKSTYMRANPQNEVFLSWVGDEPWVTSIYGKRTHPKTKKKNSPHPAIDVSCTLGEPVYAVSDGLVTASFLHGTPGKGCGNLIDIDHGYGMGAEWGSHYCHFQKRMVKVGDTVEAGQQIGTCGSTGSSTGPHVHIQLNRNKKSVDPLGYLPEGWEYTEKMKKKLGLL